MTDTEYALPLIDGVQRIPVLKRGASRHIVPEEAGATLKQDMGLGARLPEGWKQLAIAELGRLVRGNRALRVFMDTCTHCGACSDKCHFFLGTADPKNMPVARQDLLRKIWRRYFTFSGKWFPWLVGARDIDEEVMEDWYRYFHQCSECRRCAVFCPFGIDTTEVTMAARSILESVGMVQEYTIASVSQARQTGNNLGMPAPVLKESLLVLEEELHEGTGIDVRLPLDDPAAEVLLVVPSADLFAEPHVDGLVGVARVLHQAGLSWTLASQASEAANFALFSGREDDMRALANNIFESARALGVRQVVIGECGHAWRVADNYWQGLLGPLDFLAGEYQRPRHVCELSLELIEAGRLDLDPAVNDDKVVTFHDSCNVARGSTMGQRPGDQFRIPRELLKASCNHFVEMAADTIREQTFCCGGGGGMLAGELKEIRARGAMPRVNALKRVMDDQGVTHIAAICAICKTQLSEVFPEYGLDRAMVVGVHQLLGEAVRLK